MAMKVKHLKFELKELTQEGQFKGYASTRSKDLGGDMLQEGAFARTIEHNKAAFPVLWFHDPTQPVGISTVMKEDGHGLYTEGQLNLDKQLGRDVHSDMKMGIVGHMSIGYSTVQSDYDKELDARLIKEVKLYEYSLLTKGFAMQPEAVVTDVKTLIEQVKGPQAMLKWMRALAKEAKGGRVLSQANIDLIQAAVEALEAVLESAGVGDEDNDRGDGAGDSGKAHSPAVTDVAVADKSKQVDTAEFHSIMRDFLATVTAMGMR